MYLKRELGTKTVYRSMNHSPSNNSYCYELISIYQNKRIDNNLWVNFKTYLIADFILSTQYSLHLFFIVILWINFAFWFESN